MVSTIVTDKDAESLDVHTRSRNVLRVWLVVAQVG